MSEPTSERPDPRRTVASGDRADLPSRVYAIPFDRVWGAALSAVEDEVEAKGASIDHSDDTAGVLRASGESGFPRHRWSVELRVTLDENGQTRVDVEAHLLDGWDLGRTGRRARRLLEAIDRASGADERSRLHADARIVLLLAALAGVACGNEPPPEPEVAEIPEPTEVEAPQTVEASYERAIAFRATGTDSTLAVVWLFENDDMSVSVRRRARGLLLRGGTWDEFLEDRSDDPASESPWRIAPSGPLRLVVGDGDRVERVIYEQGDRLLDLEFRGDGAAWTGSRGGSFAVEDAVVTLGDRALSGQVVDLSRARRPEEEPGGDWAFLTSGDSIAIVLQAPGRTREENAFQGWVLRGDREILLPRLSLLWTGTRAYDEARRDVPIAWSLTDPDGELTGSLQVRAVRLRPGEGEGPLLPVDGLFEVVGVVTLEGVEREVEGVLRHRQGDQG